MDDFYSIDTYAVIGNPVSHSKSPLIHTEFAKQTSQQLQYIKIEAPLATFKETLMQFKEQGGKGCNITLPFKQQAFALMEQTSERAVIAKAVNTIVIKTVGNFFGDNTDGIGLVNDLTINHQYSLRDKNILIVGAGGAVQGILAPLLAAQPQTVLIANRTVAKAMQLAIEFKEYGNVIGAGFEDLPNKTFDIIINGTSASLKAELPPLANSLIHPEVFCYDMAYGSKPTVFMEWAKSLGAINVFDGLGMLVEQAAESFYLWRGVRPQTKTIIEKLRLA